MFQIKDDNESFKVETCYIYEIKAPKFSISNSTGILKVKQLFLTENYNVLQLAFTRRAAYCSSFPSGQLCWDIKVNATVWKIRRSDFKYLVKTCFPFHGR